MKVGPERRLLVLAFAVLAWIMVLGIVPSVGFCADAPKNLLANPDLVKGAGNSPDDWQTQAWQEGPEYSTYIWSHEAGGPGELSVTNIKPNDARWAQSLNLSAGWYHFSADVRAENVGKDNTGASLSVMEDGIMSPDLKGNADWQQVGFYLKVGKKGADLEVACRIGGYGSLNTGTVRCRNIRLEKVAAPPANAPAQYNYDLDKIRKESAEVPIGSPWTLVATFLFLLGVSVLGWRTFGQTLEPRKADEQPIKRMTDQKR